MALADGHVDVDEAIEGASLVVVTAIDSTQHEGIAQIIAVSIDTGTVVHQYGIGAVILHVSFVHIAGLVGFGAIAATEDAADLNSGALRHVDQRAAGDTLLVAGTVGCTDVAAHQVDDGRGTVEVERRIALSVNSRRLAVSVFHADTSPGTCTEDLHIAVFVEVGGFRRFGRLGCLRRAG